MDPIIDPEERQKQMRWVGEIITEALAESYQRQKTARTFRGDLPLLVRAWGLAFVETSPPVLMVVYRPGYFNPAAVELSYAYADENPGLSKATTIEQVEEIINPGEIVDARFCEYVKTPFYSGFDFNEAKAFAIAWGIELADQHIANTKPDFVIAQDRMTTAYSKLFELEHGLRDFIERTLETHFKTKDWWDKAKIDQRIKDDVSAKQADRTGLWVDEIEPTSILRFVEFSHYRTIIMDNQGAFRSILGPKERPNNRFVGSLSRLEILRNRIGHMNTLSDYNLHDFYADTKVVLAAIQLPA